MSFLEENRDLIFKKYSFKELLHDIQLYKYNKGKLTKVLNHFFEELIYESKSFRGKLSPMQALQDDLIIKEIKEYINSKPNFYTGDDIENIKSFFRNGGKIACKVANFCPVNARKIYKKYFKNKKINVLDISAGFGARMSAALLSNFNYVGIDPNVKLCKKLNEYGDFLKNKKLTIGDFKIYNCGSEEFISELCENFDIMFTSPPYYNLEIYSDDEKQSINYGSYEKWLEFYVEPTIKNVYRYLKKDAYALINIKNWKQYNMFDDWKFIFEKNKFNFLEIFEIKHQSKKNYIMNTNYSKEQYVGFKEPIMVFTK